MVAVCVSVWAKVVAEFILVKHCVHSCLFFGRRGLIDDVGAEAMMMDALDKVEKELKKPLMRNDKRGMALLMAEFDKVNQK